MLTRAEAVRAGDAGKAPGSLTHRKHHHGSSQDQELALQPGTAWNMEATVVLMKLREPQAEPASPVKYGETARSIGDVR